MKVGVFMRSFRQAYQNKKGFTLIEVILGICISSILLMCFYSLLNYTSNITKYRDQMDTCLSNGRYALLYIKDEIKNCDKIIDICKIEGLDDLYPENIGFVIMTINDDAKNYNYISYYLKDDELRRLACNLDSEDYPLKSDFKGYNVLCKNIKSIDKFNYDFDKNILKIRLTIHDGRKDFNFKSNIFLNCPVDLVYGGKK